MTTWLTGACSDPRGLLIPGGPHGRGASLLLGPETVQISHIDTRIFLSWNTYDRTRKFGVADSWSLAFWGGGGQGIGVDGPAALDPLRAATSSVLTGLAGWNPYNHYMSEYPILPLWALQTTPIWIIWQRSEMDALIRLLRDRPDLRPALLDQQRSGQLAADLPRQPEYTGAGLGVTPSAGAVTRALEGLGYTFPYGRPLPGDSVDPLDVVLDRVMSRLADNSWHNAQVTPKRAAELIKAHYLDVAPWPFSALGV